jgi:hypothetical protein
MSRMHGRKGRLYVQLASADAEAQPLTYQNKWTLSSATDTVEGTAFEDNNKTYFAGLPDASGTFAGFLDDATTQTYAASRDGQPRKFYLYPSTLAVTKYFFGTAIFDFSTGGGTAEMASASGSWKAASDIQRVG